MKRWLGWLVIGIVAGAALTIAAQPAKKIWRIGYLSSSDPATEASRAEAIRLALNVDDFDRVFAALNKQRPDGLSVLGGRVMNDHQKRIVGFALKSRLPAMYPYREAVEVGGLMSYSADLADSHRRVAYYVGRILKGAKAADLPVEQPMKFEFVVNLKTAKQIGVTIAPNVLVRADRVIR